MSTQSYPPKPKNVNKVIHIHSEKNQKVIHNVDNLVDNSGQKAILMGTSGIFFLWWITWWKLGG